MPFTMTLALKSRHVTIIAQVHVFGMQSEIHWEGKEAQGWKHKGVYKVLGHRLLRHKHRSFLQSTEILGAISKAFIMLAKRLNTFCFVLPYLLTSIYSTVIPDKLESPTTCPTCSYNFDAGVCPPPHRLQSYPDSLIQFDELATAPFALGNVPDPPPTPYDDLYYKNFQVSSIGLVDPLSAHSKPNVGIIDTENTIMNVHGVITKDYPNSRVQTYDMKSFYFGCKLASETGNGAPAQQCTLQVTGYKQSATNPAVCDIAGVSFSDLLPAYHQRLIRIAGNLSIHAVSHLTIFQPIGTGGPPEFLFGINQSNLLRDKCRIES